jgi:hypothetical protein
MKGFQIYVALFLSVQHSCVNKFWGVVWYWGLNSGTQGLALAKQALYNLSNTPSLFALVIFQIGPHVYAQAVLDCYLPIHASPVTEMTDTYRYAQRYCLR